MATTRTITNAWVTRTLPDIFYEEPEIAEDAVVQEAALDRIKHLLMQRYGKRADVFISGLFYVAYDIADGNRRVQPDCFIAFDVDAEAIRRNLPHFWVWEAGKVPDFVMEVASPSTAANDLGHKRDLYAELGVSEYWRFDSTGGDLYGQPLVGERLVAGEYQPYESQVGEDGSVRSYSELLDLEFYWNGEEFDVLDPETGKTIDLLDKAIDDLDKVTDDLDKATDALEAEREARIAAEAREQALLTEIARLRQQQTTR